MIKTGDFAPEFTLFDKDGTPYNLKEHLQNGPLVLFFYPQAETFGCVREACAFRDQFPDFEQAGAQVAGISSDSITQQKEFSTNRKLPFSLLSDPDFTAHAQFGFDGKRKVRATFVIGEDGKVLLAWQSRIAFRRHMLKALEAVKQIKAEKTKK
jgi:thioredoxin-dependent peroxiredoxin